MRNREINYKRHQFSVSQLHDCHAIIDASAFPTSAQTHATFETYKRRDKEKLGKTLKTTKFFNDRRTSAAVKVEE